MLRILKNCGCWSSSEDGAPSREQHGDEDSPRWAERSVQPCGSRGAGEQPDLQTMSYSGFFPCRFENLVSGESLVKSVVLAGKGLGALGKIWIK